MLRSKQIIAKLSIGVAVMLMVLMPVVRTFYGLTIGNFNAHSYTRSHVKKSHLGPVIKNISWSLIRDKQLSLPAENRIKFVTPVFIPTLLLFVSLLLLGQVWIAMGYYSSGRPLIWRCRYLLHRLLLI